MMMRFLSVCAASAVFLLSSAAHGDVIMRVTEAGGNVRFDYSGTLDLTGHRFSTMAGVDQRQLGRGGDFFANTFATPAPGVRSYLGPFSSLPGDWLRNRTTFASSRGGDYFQVVRVFRNPLQLSEANFTGDVWSGSGFLQFNNTSLVLMGVDLTSDAVWTLGNPSTDTITFTTAAATAAAAVPEPSSFALLGLGGIGFLIRRRRKSRADATAESHCAASER